LAEPAFSQEQTAQALMSAADPQVLAQTPMVQVLAALPTPPPTGLWVIDADQRWRGTIDPRDLALALHYGCGADPVADHMDVNRRAIAPDTPRTEIEFLLTTQGWAALPVVEQGRLVGMVPQAAICTTPVPHPTHPMSHAFLLPILQQRLVPELWQVLTVAALLAGQRGWQLYIVGGAVRDLLRLVFEGSGAGSLLLEDIDLVVEGGDRPAAGGAGVEIAMALHTWYPAARLTIHEKFQTAALQWREDPRLRSLGLDLATARTEVYTYPAANPQISPSSLTADLYRRDFTMNAMAIRLTEGATGEAVGELLDFYGGVGDLQQRQVRVLHAHSFIEDPTRIFRAVRFATRLGYGLEAQTERWIRSAIARGIFPRVQRQHAIVPALQTRLKAELKYLLQTTYWQPALTQLADLGALQCLHPHLVLDADLWRQLRLAQHLHAQVSSEPLWELLLALLMAHLPPAERQTVAENLRFRAEWMGAIAAAETQILEKLSHCDRPSQVRQQLQTDDRAILMLIAIRCPRHRQTPMGQPLRRLIWHYLTRWSTVKPPLNGKALKQLGYPPGPQLRQILDALTVALIDGEIRDRKTALTFLAQRFPLR
jgi:tRNA nucleotidyltransferase (CCA-adding enzyme)